MEILTLRRETDNPVWSNDIVGPGSLLLQPKQMVLLYVVEIQALVIIARHAFLYRTFHRPEVDSVMLGRLFVRRCKIRGKCD